MRFPTLIRFVALVLTVCNVAGFTTHPVHAQDHLRVTTTFSILEDIVQQVGGDLIDVQTVVPAGGDAHTFDPSPEQVAHISDADVIFAIGLEFEPWLPDMITASGTSGSLISVTDGLQTIHAEEHHEVEHEAADHEHGDINPHVWGDVQNVIAIAEVVRDTLSTVDPEHSANYQANAASYIAELEALDSWIREQVATIPEEHRILVTTHNTFAYFAQAYGFQIIGDVLSSISTESGDPSAGEFAEIVEAIEHTGVPAIFPENVVNSDLIESIAAEAGVQVGPALYTDALGEPGTDGDTYIRMQQYNVTSIVAALAS